MELLLLFVVPPLFLIIVNWLNNLGTPEDTREPYVRDASGSVLALYIAGPANNLPPHERFIHAPRGLSAAHQNPAVREYTGVRWILLLPFPEDREERFYPLTNNGIPVNVEEIRQRIAQASLRRGQVVNLVTMPRWAERQSIRREHGEQLGRGVPGNKLRRRDL